MAAMCLHGTAMSGQVHRIASSRELPREQRRAGLGEDLLQLARQLAGEQPRPVQGLLGERALDRLPRVVAASDREPDPAPA